MKNAVLRGSVILVIAGILGKLLGAFFRIPLSNILGAEGIGIYQMIFPIFSLALIICSGGVSYTLSHIISQIRASKNGNIKKEFFKGFFYSLTTSSVFAFLFFVLSGRLAEIQGNAFATLGYKLVGIALIFASLLACFRGLYQGYQNMLPTALSQTIEQLFKVVFGLGFSYFFRAEGIEMQVAVAFLGIGIAEILAFVYLILRSKKFNFETFPEQTFSSRFYLTNFSITLGFLIIPILTCFDSFVVVNILKKYFTAQVATSLYGLQSGLVNSLINFPVVISIAISLALLPNLTYSISENNKQNAQKTIEKVFAILFFVLAPCIIILYFFAEEIMALLYPSISQEMLEVSVMLLKISAPQILFISFLQISITVFQSLDKPAISIYVLLLSGVFKVISTLLFVNNPGFNIAGLALSNFVFYAIAAIIALIIVKKNIPFNLPQKQLKFMAVVFPAFALGCLLINVCFVGLMAKITLLFLLGLFGYLLPILKFDILNINSLLKEKLTRRKINEQKRVSERN